MREQGTTAEWSGWDGSGHEVLSLGFENGGWTADGVIQGVDIHYVIRVDERWRLRQFLLFRDLPDPDLWLGVDPTGRWGEVNGLQRPELDGCTAVELACTPFTTTLPIRRHHIAVGDHCDILVARVDHETLAVLPERRRYTHLTPERWQCGDVVLEVDDHGLVRDHPSLFRRLV